MAITLTAKNIQQHFDIVDSWNNLYPDEHDNSFVVVVKDSGDCFHFYFYPQCYTVRPCVRAADGRLKFNSRSEMTATTVTEAKNFIAAHEATQC